MAHARWHTAGSRERANFSALFVGRVIVVVLLAMALSGCAPDVPPINCEDPDFSCFLDQATKGILVARQNIAYWSLANMICQFAIVVAGIVATIMIALHDASRAWTRPVGLIAGALATGITGGLASFNVTNNIDKLVDVVFQMTTVASQFDFDSEKLKAGRSPEEIQSVFKNDENFRNAANQLTYDFTLKWNKIKIETFRPATARPPSSKQE